MTALEEVAVAFRRALGVEVVALRRLSGGASRVTSVVDVEISGGTRPVVLQQRRGSAVSASASVTGEAELLRAARDAGVPVPLVIAAGSADGLQDGWLVVEWLAGETIPRRILRDESFASARSLFAAQTARALARIHSVDFGRLGALPETDPLADPLTLLDATNSVRPVLEIAARWLSLRPCPSFGRTVVHGDFRLGNLLVDARGLQGVLDWELAHVGDPVEDIGWLTAPAWRFGGRGEVGGMGELDDFLLAYNTESGRSIDAASVRWWQAFAALKWAAICALQAASHLSGAVVSVELAAIGRRVCECEWDLLSLMGVGDPHGGATPDEESDSPGARAPFGRPTSAELVDAVATYLERKVMDGAEGAARFEARVARNALAVVSRELVHGPAAAKRHGRRLDQLGFASDRDLARAIRSGDLDSALTDTADVMSGSVADQLTIANPGYLAKS